MSNKKLRHSANAALFLNNGSKASWHDETLWFVRSKRDKAANGVQDWEVLRETASRIKEHTLSNLHQYLLQFENKAKQNGISVHWAKNADEHNAIVHRIIQQNRAKGIVKSKSMLTEECKLNEYLYQRGIEVLDTDLGEYIVQLRKEPPSHIVLPAIHLKTKEVSDTFHKYLQTEKDNLDPSYLTRAAREALRKKILTAEVAISGVNFAVAETGGLVVCTNEGNADLAINAAGVHIASMGLEKLIPKQNHLAVFLRLLARSATGQAITTYSSHLLQPRNGQEMHVILVDNGRTTQLGREEFRNSLKCIRCGACFNTCPVYRRSGGHSYHTSIAGPIGSILAPNLDMRANSDLPFASTLCGSCSNVCPVKINIHEQLWHWRQVIADEGYGGTLKNFLMKAMALVLSRPWLYHSVGKVGRLLLRLFPKAFTITQINPWSKGREMPIAPKQSFNQWFRKQQNNGK